jgi:hypothetical protein
MQANQPQNQFEREIDALLAIARGDITFEDMLFRGAYYLPPLPMYDGDHAFTVRDGTPVYLNMSIRPALCFLLNQAFNAAGLPLNAQNYRNANFCSDFAAIVKSRPPIHPEIPQLRRGFGVDLRADEHIVQVPGFNINAEVLVVMENNIPRIFNINFVHRV